MNELSLYTGVGGGLLGSLILGHKIIGAVEIDEYCQKVLRQRQEDGILEQFPIFGDIRAFIDSGCAELYQGVTDVITAGFPCQPFSVAGKQRGSADERNMWPETIDTIRIIQPKYVLLENVPGLTYPERFTLYRNFMEGKVYSLEEWGQISRDNEVQITLPSYFGRVLGDLAESGYDAKWRVLGADDCGGPHKRKRAWILAYTRHNVRVDMEITENNG